MTCYNQSMRSQLSVFTLALFAFLSAPPVEAQEAAKPIPTIATKTAAMKHMAGFFPLDWDAKSGKLFLEIPKLDASGRSADVLYMHSLPYGAGSNDLGLDRGQISDGVVVRFERTGPKVLLVQPNQAFRSSSHDASEVAAVEQSFPRSVLWGFKVEAEDPSGAVLVDATDFYLRDAHDVVANLAQQKQGSYKLDTSRSTIALDATKAFPKNTVVEAELTFTAEDTGKANYVRDVSPDPKAMTLRERQNFVELPPLDSTFQPRAYNPRAGFFGISFRDYTAPLGDDIDKRFITRHRLIKKNAACTRSCEAVRPIQYYVDRGAPEPIRTALVEGARWWDDAFQAAGWAKDTFRVDVLPEGADVMDVRYNVIQWVHRYTRGWSYGAEIADPRTGEILKGNVTLGSLRGRQDYLIAEALLAPYASGNKLVDSNGNPLAGSSANDPMLQMVLARIRQLSAHETGHTLGLAHNFAASSISQGNSVMDYPHPSITLDSNGAPDLTHAYAAGIGAWDKIAIDYGYRAYPQKTDEAAALKQVLAAADKQGQVFITDADARPFGGAHPSAHLWDNGKDAVDELNRILEIRSAALKRFGENAVRPGTPMARIEETLVPLYLLHRYQTEAAIKLLGGLDYRYNLRGDGQPGPRLIDNAEQKRALAAVLKTLEPNTLTLSEDILRLLPPHPPEYGRTRESFPSHTGLAFDPLAAAEAAADLTLNVLMDPARASRMLQYHMRVPPTSPSLREVLEAVSKTVAERPEGGHTMSSEVERAVETRALEAMIRLAANEAASSQARAIALSHLKKLEHDWTTTPPPTDTAEAIHRAAMIDRLQQFLRAPEKFTPSQPVPAPPGMPIGDEEVM